MNACLKIIIFSSIISTLSSATCIGVNTNDEIFFNKLKKSFLEFGSILKEVPNNLKSFDCPYTLIFPLSQKKLTNFNTKTTLHVTLYEAKKKIFNSITYQTTANKNLVDLTDPTFSVKAYQKIILKSMAQTVTKFITKE